MSYPGGKNGDGVYQTIINRMPPHDVYIEPFLGGGAIMRLKKPARLNIGLDLDPGPIAAFGGAVPPARNDDARSRAIARRAENGDAGSSEFRIFAGDALEFLRTYSFLGSELVYCDPPYMAETRTSRQLYRCEMRDADHAELLRIVRRLPCMVMLSGYFTRLYDVELRDWHAIHFPAMTRGGERTEWLWANFPEPVALHDYRYLGADFRQREAIKRKKKRWVSRIERMPLLERRALLSAMAEAGLAATSTSAGNGDACRRRSSNPSLPDPIAVSAGGILQERRNGRG